MLVLPTAKTVQILFSFVVQMPEDTMLLQSYTCTRPHVFIVGISAREIYPAFAMQKYYSLKCQEQ